jgi:hypothetical protein
MPDYEKQLQKEREKLDRLVDEALKSSTPINKTYAIMDQSRRVDRLVAKLEVERGRNGR